MSIFKNRGLLLASCLLAGLTEAAAAQPDAQPAPLDELPEGHARWTARLDLYAYYVAPNGDLQLPGGATPGDETDLEALNLDSPQIEPFGALHLAFGRWRVSLDGLGFGATVRSEIDAPGRLGAAPVFAGERVETDLSYQTFSAVGGYRFFEHRRGPNPDGTHGLTASLEAVGGVRFSRVDFDVRVTDPVAPRPAGTPLSTSADGFWAAPIVGLRGGLDFSEMFAIDLWTSAGGMVAGDNESFTFDLGVVFTYRPTPLIGLQAGYRLLINHLERDDGADEFRWEGDVAGIYWGVQLSF